VEADRKRILKPAKEYDHYFPKADFKETLVIKGKARLEDTMRLIKAVIVKDRQDTEKIAKILKGSTPKDTARKVWNFVYEHIQYIADRQGVEEIRRPARLWADRNHGGDCDCMSVFIGTILDNQQLPYTLRIAEYNKGYYQHIYPIVITDQRFYADRENRNYYIVVDCVKNNFDDEHPFRKIKDFDIKKMDLAYLSGLGDTGDRFDGLDATTDTLDAMQGMGLSDNYIVDGLGKIRKKRKKGAATASAAAAASALPALVPKTEARKFEIKRSNIYKLNNGTLVKLGKYVRAAGERVVLFKRPEQSGFTESGVLNENTFFVDNGDTAWGIATINGSYWKKPDHGGWMRTSSDEYNQAQNNRKQPIYLKGYILKDETRIFLDKRMPQNQHGFPVKWKQPDSDGWTANGSLTSMHLAEEGTYVIGRNGAGNYYKSTGYTTWAQIQEEEYMTLKSKALKGLNDVDSSFTLTDIGEVTLNAPSDARGLYIPYDTLLTLFRRKIDPQRSYKGIEGLGFLLGDSVLNAIEPLLDGPDELSGDQEVTGMFGEMEIVGLEGYYDNVGDLAALTHELLGEESLMIVDGLGKVRRRKAKRKGKGGGTAADSKGAAAGEGAKTTKKLGLYIPSNTMSQLLQWRNENLSRLQNKGMDVTRGEVGSIDGFFDIIKAPLKMALEVAKFIPIPGVAVAANLIDKTGIIDKIPSSQPVQQANHEAQRQNNVNHEVNAAYDQEMAGIGSWGTKIFTTIKKNPVQTLLIAGGVGAVGYMVLKKDKKPLFNGLFALDGTPKRKRRKYKKAKAKKVKH